MSSTDKLRLSCRELGIAVPGRRLVKSLTVDICSGEILAILGPNGVGKSLTLHTISGLRPADGGDVLLGDTDISAISRPEIATQLALLPQYTEDVFPATVLDTVLIGRHPHIGRFQWESATDIDLACTALADVDLIEFRDRRVATLSGGERKRLAVAQILAQSPDIYLLDEPSNHLDPQHQLEVMEVFESRVKNGAAVVASLHDVNLAARFADRCLLLYGDGNWDLGHTENILTEERLTTLYSTPMEAISWRNSKIFIASGHLPH